MKNILLIGIGGVYNYGCEAIVRGTETILHSEWPDAKIIYASYRPDDDKTRLAGCSIDVVRRTIYVHRRYSLLNIIRKLSSIVGINWNPLRESPELLEDKDVILSIGGDIYTLGQDNNFNKNLPIFGDYAEKRGIPYALWGASVGPFTKNPEAERYFRKHLSNISLITARERSTVDYLAKIGVFSNVVSCADPAFAVETGIVKKNSNSKDKTTIAINLSPLSVGYIGLTVERGIEAQTRMVELIIKKFDANVILVPHVVCDFNERDDDRRYLRRIQEALAHPYRDRIQMLDGDPGFIGVKKILTGCDLVIAARMHCAINAMTAHVPTLLLAYSQKAKGMGDYIYRHTDWVLPLEEFCSEKCIAIMGNMLDNRLAIQAQLSKRIPEVQADAILPIQALKKVLTKI